MSAPAVTLTMPARAEWLLLARLTLSGLARTVRLDAETLADLKLAVTEACANSVRHAYGEEGGHITVRYAVVADALEIVVEDDGAGFEAAGVEEWSPDELGEEGMGLAIIRAVVDELEIGAAAEGRGARLRLVKRLAV